jgi:hypothetical protein
MMPLRSEIFGEGASTPWFRSESGTESGLVLCPMLPLGARMDASTMHEIYRLAYERARAALRPSIYEIAQRICWN